VAACVKDGRLPKERVSCRNAAALCITINLPRGCSGEMVVCLIAGPRRCEGGTKMFKLLEGIRVLESALLLNGGQVGMIFADLGAEVIKIEDPKRGDYIRDILGQISPRESPAHLQVHKNKKSVALDVRAERGREIFFELLKSADVFIDGLRAGVCDSMGIGYAAQQKVRPEIVYVQCTGFGATGPYASVPTHGYQMTALAGGMPAKMGPDGQVERLHRVQYMGGTEESGSASILGAQAAATAAIAALVRRGLKGKGAYIDVAASDAVIAASWQGVVYKLNYHRITDFKSLPRLQETYEAKWPAGSTRYQLYRTQDDRFLLVGFVEPKFWNRFCEAVGRNDLAATIRPNLEIDYGEDKPFLRQEIQGIISQRTLGDWMELAARLSLPLGPAHNIDDLAGDPHLQARGVFIDTSDADRGDFTYVGYPARINEEAYGDIARAPRHGEHTEEVLSSVGVSAEEIADLRTKRQVT
jgi:crotonobetainyl-CoA:carnitine CoA-transferase CaiB-like acyl-CoA transferase